MIQNLDILDESYLDSGAGKSPTQDMLVEQQQAMTEAVQRLNKYISSLKMHILSIVQCESAEFLKMADRLEIFSTHF